MIRQGDVWWIEMPGPKGSEPGLRRPVVVVQGDVLNKSGLSTVVIVPCTTNLDWGPTRACVLLPAEATGLPHDSVALAHSIDTQDRSRLRDRVGRLPPSLFESLLHAIDRMLGR